MVEKMRQCPYKGTTSTALLIGIKKAFYCLPQDLWIDKLHASESEKNSSKLLLALTENK